MTVTELIDALKKCDPDMRVVVKGYERGFDDIRCLEVIEISLDAERDSGVYGDHQRPEHAAGDFKVVSAVYIRPTNEWRAH